MATQQVPVESRGVSDATRRHSLWTRVSTYRLGYLFVLPWVLIYAVFGIYPLLLSFYLTFLDYSFVRPEDMAFVGMGNWIRGLTDLLFWQSIFNVFYNQTIYIVLKNGLGLVTALLLKQVTWGGRIFRTIYFLPVLASVIVMTTIGNYLVSPAGPLQGLLVRFGIIENPIFWQASFWLPMPIIALMNTWKWFGISTVILLAGLYAIDPQFYEAASLDGATAWQKFRTITIPQLMPQIFFLLVMDFIYGLQMFAEVFALFDIGAGNAKQALTPVLYLYAQAFDRSNMGYGSTLGLLLAALIALVTVLQFRFVKQETD